MWGWGEPCIHSTRHDAPALFNRAQSAVKMTRQRGSSVVSAAFATDTDSRDKNSFASRTARTRPAPSASRNEGRRCKAEAAIERTIPRRSSGLRRVAPYRPSRRNGWTALAWRTASLALAIRSRGGVHRTRAIDRRHVTNRHAEARQPTSFALPRHDGRRSVVEEWKLLLDVHLLSLPSGEVRRAKLVEPSFAHPAELGSVSVPEHHQPGDQYRHCDENAEEEEHMDTAARPEAALSDPVSSSGSSLCGCAHQPARRRRTR